LTVTPHRTSASKETLTVQQDVPSTSKNKPTQSSSTELKESLQKEPSEPQANEYSYSEFLKLIQYKNPGDIEWDRLLTTPAMKRLSELERSLSFLIQQESQPTSRKKKLALPASEQSYLAVLHLVKDSFYDHIEWDKLLTPATMKKVTQLHKIQKRKDKSNWIDWYHAIPYIYNKSQPTSEMAT
jgi:hypothetical protein